MSANPEIRVRYGAVRSPVTGRADAWAPAIEINGKLRVEWRAIDRHAAKAAARVLADDERRRWVGDWTITVEALP